MNGGKGDPFHVTYGYILNNDIRYMYSGSPVDLYRGRGDGDYPNFDMLRIARENVQLKQRTLRVSRYGHDEPFMLPRAPAFRDTPEKKVNIIVSRLMKPTICRVGYTPEEIRAKDPLVRTKFPSYQKKSPREVEQISFRLYRSHTHISQMKNRDPQDVRNSLPIMKSFYTRIGAYKANENLPVVQA
ncbi:hypothetical protein ACJMK2_038626 [Sinanodonta woodiana]|uniref:Uncharacterized protein n=1 Tax=Sinanodonta woodiana TaxID=1069815 RepID=A0ABD3WCM9_SINWO